MTDHVVRDGECLASIAYEHGFFWETLWNLPENAKLKELRKEPTVLLAGDVVHIPDLRVQPHDRATGASHRFRRKGVPGHLRLRMTKPDEPETPEDSQEPPDDEAMVTELTQEAELDRVYLGKVKRITDFGAFVEIFPGTDGLIHISHLAEGRVEKVTDVVSEGDEVLAKCIDIDPSGRIRLSRKEALADAAAKG